MREAGTAYGTVSKWLRGATIETCSSDEQQTWSCILTRPNGYSGVIMWNPNSSIQVPVPAGNLVQFRNWQDTVSPLAATATVSPVPILLENENTP
jgi:hypothetical protein